MNRTPKLVICIVALMCTGGAFAQTPDAQTDTNAIDGPNTAPVANVYVSTTSGTNLYHAASNGKLSTAVSGSPFQTVGEIIGSNGKYFITLGNVDIHSYKVASNGAIEGQVSTIDTQNYNGVNCGATNGAVLDHTGQNIYVLLDLSGSCGAYQTFSIAKTTGGLSFKTAAVNNNIGLNYCCSVPSLPVSEPFAYSVEQYFYCDGCKTTFGGFKHLSNGELENLGSGLVSPIGPKPQSANLTLSPITIAADKSNHLAVIGVWYDENAQQYTDGIGLVSFTVESNGDIKSTNTWKEMPEPDILPNDMRMSPSGKLLAIGGSGGLQVLHFNGAAPITTYGGLLTTTEIDHVYWDNDNHLYALSDAYNMYSSPEGKAELYVYTVTPASITEAPGSPYHIAGSNGLVVVP